MAYTTYDDFVAKAQEAGVYDQFSEYDLQLAQKNPDAGMSLLSYKLDYKNATTDDQRVAINLKAENLRSKYGSYTGGTSGDQFYLDNPSPGDFTYGEAPTFGDEYKGMFDSQLGKVVNHGSYSGQYEGDIANKWSAINNRPDYQSEYKDKMNAALDNYANREDFSYTKESDPSWNAYAKQYRREGDRATQNAMASASSASGGIPSSYAMTAASQAGDYYGSKLADKVPELYQQAYGRYMDDLQMEQNEFQNYLNADQNAYNQYYSNANLAYNDLEAVRGLDNDAYGRWYDGKTLDQNALNSIAQARGFDLDKYQVNLGQHNTDRDFNYGQFYDDINYDFNVDANKQTQKNYEDEQRRSQEQLDKQMEWERELAIYQLTGDDTGLKRLLKMS